MIDEIQVENLALIRKAELLPSRGLTVLTGETGAGKSALLSAMKLLMGARADKDAVRDGQDALVVSGRFYGNEISDELTKDARPNEGFPEEELVVTRRVSADGRSRVSIDGCMASVKELANTIALTVDLCGQHEHQRLMQPASHMSMLDAWASVEIVPVHAAYREAFEVAQQAAKELERVCAASAASTAQLEEARFVLRSIDAVNPYEGEYEELKEELARVEHSEALAVAAGVACEALSSEDGAMDALTRAVAAFDSVSTYDAKLGEYAEALREAGYAIEDIAHEARSYAEEVEFDPEELAEKQERMAALQGLMRLYGPGIEQVLLRRKEAAELVSLVDDADWREQEAQKAVDQAEELLRRAADSLEEVRASSAPRFAAEVSTQMQRLEMSGAQLTCNFVTLPRASWTKAGSTSLEFLFCSSTGMQARPLVRIASGGEISRVMLAIKVVLGKTDQVDTLIFDEVDAGVGGSAAVALAEVLAELATTHQVIVVTHLAQVAVRGHMHYVVRKIEGEDGMLETELSCLTAEERPAEIARMLSGETTDTSLAHACELINAAAAK